MSILSVALRREITKSVEKEGIKIRRIEIDASNKDYVETETYWTDDEVGNYHTSMQFNGKFFTAEEFGRMVAMCIKNEIPFIREELGLVAQ